MKKELVRFKGGYIDVVLYDAYLLLRGAEVKGLGMGALLEPKGLIYNYIYIFTTGVLLEKVKDKLVELLGNLPVTVQTLPNQEEIRITVKNK